MLNVEYPTAHVRTLVSSSPTATGAAEHSALAAGTTAADLLFAVAEANTLASRRHALAASTDVLVPCAHSPRSKVGVIPSRLFPFYQKEKRQRMLLLKRSHQIAGTREAETNTVCILGPVRQVLLLLTRAKGLCCCFCDALLTSCIHCIHGAPRSWELHKLFGISTTGGLKEKAPHRPQAKQAAREGGNWRAREREISSDSKG